MQGRTGTPMCRITGGFGRHLNSAECEEIPFGHNPQKRSGRPVDLALQPSFRGMLVSGSRQQQKFQICWCWPGIMRFERKFRSCRDEYPVAGIQSRDTALDVARRPVLIGYMRVSKADGSQALDLQRDALLSLTRSRGMTSTNQCLTSGSYFGPPPVSALFRKPAGAIPKPEVR
jgi:hypothetical protein